MVNILFNIIKYIIKDNITVLYLKNIMCMLGGKKVNKVIFTAFTSGSGDCG